MKKILLVDDEIEILNLIEMHCTQQGYTCMKSLNAKTALQILDENIFDLAVLDIMLPDMDGFSLCTEIRKDHQFPIIMLTAKKEMNDKVKGLMIGADDYMEKPFNPLELMARIQAQLRRIEFSKDDSEIDINGLYLNSDLHECRVYNEIIHLTPTEFKILFILCQNRNKVVNSETLFEQIWKEKYYDTNNTVMVHIQNIRQKLKSVDEKRSFIKTVWGVGYIIHE